MTEKLRLKGLLLLIAVLAGACLAGCDRQPTSETHSQPQAATSITARHMVVSAHPRASEIGREILRAGGSAVDAAVAVQMALAVLEVPETGLGGGGFLLHLDAASGAMAFFDGRETAPAAAQDDRFTWLGRAMPHAAAVVSGRSVGTPGLVAMLAMAHSQHGRLPWAQLLAPAIALADEGAPMPARLIRQLRADASLRLFSDIRRSYFQALSADPVVLHQPRLAATLRALAAQGPDAFYTGGIASEIVARAAARAPWRGDLDAQDLAGYRALVREPVCGHYRQWRICGAPPPSSAGIVVLQVLGMLEHFPMAELGSRRGEAMHLIAEASRLAFADRARWIADPAYVQVPVDALIDRGYLRARAALISRTRAMTEAPAGDPRGGAARGDPVAVSADRSAGTSHFTVIDQQGNVAALTSSIEAPFGSRMQAAGFLLNNQLTDFTFVDRAADYAEPNLPAPGKRPRSSMSPLLVFDADDSLVLALGARGGSRIIGHVTRVLIATLDWQQPLAEAVAEGNFLHRGEGLEVERGTALSAYRADLRALGHRVRVRSMASGLHGVARTEDGWQGVADPRLDGAALGD